MSQVHQQSKEVHQQSKHNSLVGALETSAPPKGKSQHLNTSTSHPTISVVIVDDDRLQGQLLNEMLRRIDGVRDASVSFLTQKLTLEADEGRFDAILREAVAVCRKIEPDCVIEV